MDRFQVSTREAEPGRSRVGMLATLQLGLGFKSGAREVVCVFVSSETKRPEWAWARPTKKPV